MNKILIFAVFGFLSTLVLALPLDSDDVGEYGNHVEGDMILTEEQMDALYGRTRNGLIATKYRWSKKTVPYELSSNHTKEQRDYIEKALKTIESVSCVKLVIRTNEVDYVEMHGEDSGCYSSVGRRGGKQVLNLANYPIEKGCFRLATIMHEYLHALGFYHMQSAHDRDEYVTIHWENVKEGTQHNFNKYTSSQVTHFNTTYDYFSVMHYSAYGFSTNGQPTIVPLDETYLNVIGQREKLSEKDILKLNAMYECGEVEEEEEIPEEEV